MGLLNSKGRLGQVADNADLGGILRSAARTTLESALTEGGQGRAGHHETERGAEAAVGADEARRGGRRRRGGGDRRQRGRVSPAAQAG